MVLSKHALAALVACALSFGATTALAANTYDFTTLATTLPPGAEVTPQTIASSTGVMATFSSPSDPGAFTFGSNADLYTLLGPYVLSSAGVPAELDISFSTAQTDLTFNFALGDFFGSGGGDVLSVMPSSGGSFLAPTAIPGTDLFPQGTFSMSGLPAFTSVAINVSGPYSLAVADVSSISAVPEPASLPMLAAGLAVVFFVIRRRADPGLKS
jgi:hypothetical protein